MAKKVKVKKPYVPPYRYVEITWVDASSEAATWVDINEIGGPEAVITRGWVVKEKDDFVCVASSVSLEEEKEDNVGNTLSIPRGMIKTLVDVTCSPKRARVKKPAAHVATLAE